MVEGGVARFGLNLVSKLGQTFQECPLDRRNLCKSSIKLELHNFLQPQQKITIREVKQRFHQLIFGWVPPEQTALHPYFLASLRDRSICSDN